jgi:hypothetical protein
MGNWMCNFTVALDADGTAYLIPDHISYIEWSIPYGVLRVLPIPRSDYLNSDYLSAHS